MEWDLMFPDKWSICQVDGMGGPNQWYVFPPHKSNNKTRRFGSHEAAVRHLVKKGW